jgi:hypothetical protein
VRDVADVWPSLLSVLLLGVIVVTSSRQKPQLSTDGKVTIFAALAGAAAYNIITNTDLSDFPTFACAGLASALLVTLGRPKFLLPARFLSTLDTDEARAWDSRSMRLGLVYGLMLLASFLLIAM